ncbi:MAG: HD domain-containing protein [Halobacteria archaeon]
MKDEAASIRDPLYGYIRVDPLLRELLDTPALQRLRRIRQLGFAHLVYPGANHTRFEHALGASHLASLFPLGRREHLREEFRVAALLHDAGHGPYSHASEGVFLRWTGRSHEEVPPGPGVEEALEARGLSPGAVRSHLRGRTPLGRALSSELDVDRMDYLVRDAYYTGVSFGRADVARLLGEMGWEGPRLYVRESGLRAAESLLVARLLMYPTVYLHHVCRIAEAMFCAGLEALLEAGADPEALRRMDDGEARAALRRAGGVAAEMAERLDGRRLYKRALWLPRAGLPARLPAPARLRREVAEEAGVEESRVLVDLPAPEPPLGAFLVKVGTSLRSLRRASPVAAALDRAHREAARAGVYAPPEARERVARAARRVLAAR